MKKLLLLLCLISGYVNGQTFLTNGRIDTIWSSGQVPRGLNNTNTWYTLFKKNPTVNYLAVKDTNQKWQNSWWSQDANYLYMHSPTAWSAKDTLLERALFRNIITGKIVERGIPYLSRDSLVFVKGGGANSIKRKDGISLSAGANSTASGPSSIASGIASIASGAASLASGDYSVASGYGSIASGSQSVALGHNSVASGLYSIASGSASTASGAYTNVLGTAITETTDSTASVNKLKIYSTPTWVSATDTTNKVLLWDATTKSVKRGVITASSSTNPTSGYLPYNNAGTFADSWLSQVGDNIVLSSNKKIISATGFSQLYFKSGYTFNLESRNWDGSVIARVAADSLQSNLSFKTNSVQVDNTKIKIDAPVINLAQSPTWAAATDTTNFKVLGRNAAGNIVRGVMSSGGSTDTTSLSNRINLKENSFSKKSGFNKDTARAIDITAGASSSTLVMTTSGFSQISKTGTGALVYGTSPTFTTNATIPRVYGGSGSSGTLILSSTTNATKGQIYLGGAGGNEFNFDETTANLGLGTAYSASARLYVKGENFASNKYTALFRNSVDTNTCVMLNDGKIGFGTASPSSAATWHFKGYGNDGKSTVYIENPTAGTATASALMVKATTVRTDVVATSSGFTASGLLVPNQSILISNGGTGGLLIGTENGTSDVVFCNSGNTLANETMRLRGTNNYVGIGTHRNAISARLQVEDSLNSTVARISMQNKWAGTTAQTWLLAKNDNAGSYALGAVTSTAFTTAGLLVAQQGRFELYSGNSSACLLNTSSANTSLIIATSGTAATNERLRVTNAGIAISGSLTTKVTVPTAQMHFSASTTAAGTSPIKMATGVLMTTAEAGAIEFDGAYYYASPSTTRKIVVLALKGTASLDFGSTAAGTSTDLTITVTGATDGDLIMLGVPNGSTLANGSFTAWVSATNTVSVRFINSQLAGALDPALGTFNVSVTKY